MVQGVQAHGEESRTQAWRLREDTHPGRGGITLKCDKDYRRGDRMGRWNVTSRGTGTVEALSWDK